MAGGGGDKEENYWPGYVDALTTMTMVLTFIMMVLGVVIFMMSKNVAKKILEDVSQATNIKQDKTSNASVDQLRDKLVQALKKSQEDREKLVAEEVRQALAKQSTKEKPQEMRTDAGDQDPKITFSEAVNPNLTLQSSGSKATSKLESSPTSQDNVKTAAASDKTGETEAQRAAREGVDKKTAAANSEHDIKTDTSANKMGQADNQRATVESVGQQTKASNSDQKSKASIATENAPDTSRQIALSQSSNGEEQTNLAMKDQKSIDTSQRGQPAKSESKIDNVSNTLIITFAKRSYELDDKAKAEIKAYLGSAGLDTSQKYVIRGYADTISGSTTDARRLAYYRVMFVRRTLSDAGFPVQNLITKVEEVSDASKGDKVQIGLAQ